MKKYALFSVSDKTGIVELAEFLHQQGTWEIISSGGTAHLLKTAGIPVIKVSDYTGSPEILGGRVKTLHPKIHGGILARRNLASDGEDLLANQINSIDLVVVNLYPFVETIAQPDVSLAEAIEQIDIGGPTLLRASAKNFQFVTVLSDPSQYEYFIQQQAETDVDYRKCLAISAFRQVQAYDQAIGDYLAGESVYRLQGQAIKTLRYGENPHQSATWYKVREEGWGSAQLLQGKELSYNNLLDLESARSLISEFVQDLPTAVIIKHNNPCGVATAPTITEAYELAFKSDSTSAFGGIVALNCAIGAEVAQRLTETFLECVVAIDCTAEAREILAKKANLRVLILPDLTASPKETVKMIAGGFLVQDSDNHPLSEQNWRVVTETMPDDFTRQELMFAWKICRHVKSNAIVITKNLVTLGIGAGQTNRVGSAQIALAQAGESARGAVLASDGFLPFDDTVKLAGTAGIRAIVQPGGSLRDQDSINSANQLGISMVFTGQRHFLH